MSAVISIDYNPAAIAAATEISRKAPKKADHEHSATQQVFVSPTNTGSEATLAPNPTQATPASGSPLATLLDPATGFPIVDGQNRTITQSECAIDNPIRDAAWLMTQPAHISQHHEPPSNRRLPALLHADRSNHRDR